MFQRMHYEQMDAWRAERHRILIALVFGTIGCICFKWAKLYICSTLHVSLVYMYIVLTARANEGTGCLLSPFPCFGWTE